jgi:hypothetical protein
MDGRDGSTIYHLPLDDTIFHTNDQLIPPRDYESLRLMADKNYGLTIAQTEDKSAREIALMAGVFAIHIE